MIQPIIAGNRLNWWERSDDMEFTNRTACLKDQYSTFTIEHGGRNYSLDRSSQQGENIADNGAAKLAYRYVSVMVLLPSFSLPTSLLKLHKGRVYQELPLLAPRPEGRMSPGRPSLVPTTLLAWLCPRLVHHEQRLPGVLHLYQDALQGSGE